MKHSITCAGLLVVALSGGLAAEPARFEDVVQNLRNPEPKVRLTAIRLLREARYPEALVPLAPLVNDPVDRVQLEAIAAQLSFALVQDLPERRRLAFLVELKRGGVSGAFESGPLAVWPAGAPAVVISELLKAVDDDNGRVREEAIYAVGLVGRPPLEPDSEARLIKALAHQDPAVRTAAAKVAGRLRMHAAGDALIRSMNDSKAPVRYASMRALGQLREPRAVTALTEQLEYHGRGEGAYAALEALARIAHPSSVPRFTARLADKDPAIRRAAAEGLARTGDRSLMRELETGASNDPSAAVRAAMLFALQKLGGHYVPRLAEFLNDGPVAVQVQEYFVELGGPIERDLLPLLHEPDATIRGGIVDVLGEIGGERALAVLLGRDDRDHGVAESARRAVDRIQMRRML